MSAEKSLINSRVLYTKKTFIFHTKHNKEDQGLTKITDKRDTRRARFIPHENVWCTIGTPKKTSGGYVGLVVILVATAILAFLYVRAYLSPTPQTVVTLEGDIMATTTSGVKSANQNLDTARAMQEKMNQQNQEINQALVE